MKITKKKWDGTEVEIEVIPVYLYSLKRNNFTEKVTGITKIEGWTTPGKKPITDETDFMDVHYYSSRGIERCTYVDAKQGEVGKNGKVWLLEDDDLRVRGAYINYMNKRITEHEKAIQNCLDAIVLMEEP